MTQHYSHTNQRHLQIGKIEPPKNVGSVVDINLSPSTLFPTRSPTQFPTQSPTQFPSQVPTKFTKDNKNDSKTNPAPVIAPSGGIAPDGSATPTNIPNIEDGSNSQVVAKTAPPTLIGKRVRVIPLPTYELSFHYDVHIGSQIASSTLREFNDYINKHFKSLALLPGTSKDAVGGVSFLTESESWGTEGISRHEIGLSSQNTNLVQVNNVNEIPKIYDQRELQIGDIGDLGDWSSVSLQYNKVMHVRFKTTFIITYKAIMASNIDDDTLNVGDEDMKSAIADMIQSYFEKSTHSVTLEKMVPGLQNLTQLKFNGFMVDDMQQGSLSASSAQTESGFNERNSSTGSQVLYGFIGAFLAIAICLMATYSKRRRRWPEPEGDKKDDSYQSFWLKNMSFRDKYGRSSSYTQSRATDASTRQRYADDFSNDGMCGVMNCVNQDEQYINEGNKSRSKNKKQYDQSATCCAGLCLG